MKNTIKVKIAKFRDCFVKLALMRCLFKDIIDAIGTQEKKAYTIQYLLTIMFRKKKKNKRTVIYNKNKKAKSCLKFEGYLIEYFII